MIDLHVHSDKSDGSLTPSQLVALAGQMHLQAFALTDHDTVAGLTQAKHAGVLQGIEVIGGIEFSTEYHGHDIHIVGLFVDETDPDFQKRLYDFVDSRDVRNQKLCANLRTAGVDISCERLQEIFPDSVITRAHMASYLLSQGYVKSRSEAFERYIGDHTKYFVPREKITPCQAIGLLLQNHCIPVLAHPTLYGLGKEALENLVGELTQAGLVAIETFYSTYTTAQQREICKLAREFGLLPSGGSDFHGANKPGLQMGVGYGSLHVGDYILDDLKARRKELFHV